MLELSGEHASGHRPIVRELARERRALRAPAAQNDKRVPHIGRQPDTQFSRLVTSSRPIVGRLWTIGGGNQPTSPHVLLMT
jgi:hypothetical protein